MRVLWVSGRQFSDSEEMQSGVWLKALAIEIVNHSNIVLGNVTTVRGINLVKRSDLGCINQWMLPHRNLNRKSEYAQSLKEFTKILGEFKPDILQIWGSENPLKILPFDKCISTVKLFTLQGVLGSIAPCVLRGISFSEILFTIGLREIIKQESLIHEMISFKREGRIERMMLNRADYVLVQSEWTLSQVFNYAPEKFIFKTDRALRSEFYSATKWFEFEHTKPIIYTTSKGYSLKGFHVLLKALALVKQQIPDIEVRVVGRLDTRRFLADGYSRLLTRLISRLGLADNISWLGSLDANHIITNLQEASVFVHTTCVESYSLALAEAMCIGTPSVLSYAGAMPELALDGRDALFFTPFDFHRCAYLLIRILKEKDLAINLSHNAANRSASRKSGKEIVDQQVVIYEEIVMRQTKQ